MKLLNEAVPSAEWRLEMNLEKINTFNTETVLVLGILTKLSFGRNNMESGRIVIYEK